MGRALIMKNVAWLMALVLVAVVKADDNPPPGLTKPSSARCLIKKYKMCYNLEHVCPKFCPDSCHVECVSCKPICSDDGSTSPPPKEASPPPSISPPDHGSGGEGKSPPPSEGGHDGKGAPPPENDHGDGKSPPPSKGDGAPPPKDDHGDGKSPPPTKGAPPPENDHGDGKSPPPSEGAPPPTVEPPLPPPVVPVGPSSPPPSTPPTTPSPPTSSPPPTLVPSTPDTPSPSPPPPPFVPVTPSPSPPTPSPPIPTPPSSPPSPGDSSVDAAAGRRKRCKNKNYPQCYGVQHVCPSACPNTCEVDCVTCKPVCQCDMPGAVCQDPRFIGGDRITFYFHGKKDKDFCLVTDPNFQINAHFIGKSNANMKRDFTWVQSIAILFGDHQLFVGTQKTATWNDAVDRLSITFDGEPILLSDTWRSTTTTITRDGSDTNSVIIEIEGLLRISAKVVPITEHESRVHNYGITEEDCFAHLELGFKFFSLSGKVNGVLGQTYGDNYVSRVKMGVPMPVLGGEKEFAVSNIFATDCSVSQFGAGKLVPGNYHVSTVLELPSMKCGSGIGGRGVVCKK